MKLLHLVSLFGGIGFTVAGCGTNPTNLAQIPSPALATQERSMTIAQSTQPVKTDEQKPALKVGDISELKDDKTCDDVGETIVYADTQNYKVSVCADKNNRQVPAFIKIAKKDGSLKIEGKAQLGWREDSFVGMDEKYGYRLRMPSSSEFNLSILSGKEFTPVVLKEGIQNYYAINRFKQINRADELTRRVDSKLSDESKREEFINYIFENKDKLGACKSIDARKDTAYFSSRLWKIDNKKYFLELACRPGAYALALNFFLIAESDHVYNYKLLNIPKIARYKSGKPIIGENGYVALTDIQSTVTPAMEHLFKSAERTLSIYMGKGSCGTISTYKIGGDKLDLIRHREGGLKECDDFRYAVDPILFPNIPLEPAK
ncbi:hypothetical protein TUMEXPCC7403_19275 [Tumidithrix helvetica PCC 7403]|uniref:hypothetical protein n=1 Tax=Tumidithrix helvetica TaxID=3457545 RepID=UPI003CB72CA5